MLLEIQVHILIFVKAQQWNMGWSYHYLIQNPSLIVAHSTSYQELSVSNSQAQISYLILAPNQVLKVLPTMRHESILIEVR